MQAKRATEPAGEDVHSEPKEATPHGGARPRPTPQVLAAIAFGTLALGGIAGKTFWSYYRAHLRQPPPLSSCVMLARHQVRKQELISGTEPHDNAQGETVYLTEGQDRAVRCAAMVDHDLSKRLAGALAEDEPARRAHALLEAVRVIPDGPAADREAATGYEIASGAVDGLPHDLEEIRTISTDLDMLYACRFSTRKRCPTRPPIPMVVWVAGVPSAIGLLGVLGVLVPRGVAAMRRLLARVLRRRSAA
jgi:hypothetical protein